MGNNISNSSDVVHCGMSAQFSLRSQLVEDQTQEVLNQSWNQTTTEATDEIRSFAKVAVNPFPPDKHVCVTVIPYFGSLAGREVNFEVFKNNTMEIHLGGESRPQQFDPLLCNKDFKLRCLEFAYDSRLQSVHAAEGGEIVPKQPRTLVFLCEQTILLNLDTIPILNLPHSLFHSLDSSGYLDINVHTWPERNGESQLISLRVKRRILVKELEWMICHKLSLKSPKQLKLFHSCCHLTSEKTVDTDKLKIDCVIELSREVARTVHTSPVVALVIMFAGRKAFQINMHVSAQLQELDKKIRSLCEITENSFLYIPSVMPSSDLKMCLNLNVPGSRNLLHPINRAFPLVGQKYNILTEELYNKLPVYKWSIKDLGITEQLGIVVFEITGPTIPLVFKQCYTLSDVNPIEMHASTDKGASAVSVNYQWNLEILFLYINTISDFAGIRGIACNDYVVEVDSLEFTANKLEELEFFQEIARNTQKRRALKLIPQILYSD